MNYYLQKAITQSINEWIDCANSATGDKSNFGRVSITIAQCFEYKQKASYYPKRHSKCDEGAGVVKNIAHMLSLFCHAETDCEKSCITVLTLRKQSPVWIMLFDAYFMIADVA